MSLSTPSTPILRSYTMPIGCPHCKQPYQLHHSDIDLPFGCSACQQYLSGECFEQGKFINPTKEPHRLYWNLSHMKDIGESTMDTILEDNNIRYMDITHPMDLASYIRIENQYYKVKFIRTRKNVGIGLLSVNQNRQPVYTYRNYSLLTNSNL
jgi:hypothetical protein